LFGCGFRVPVIAKKGRQTYMGTKLIQLERRVTELEKLADDVAYLAERQTRMENVQPELSIKGQQWYRGARELLVQQDFSGLNEFENCYRYHVESHEMRAFSDIEQYINRGTSDRNKFAGQSEAQEHYGLFAECFAKARALFLAALEEVKSRELPVKSALSFAVSADEFETAQELLKASKDEPILRASGVVARVALERHLFTVAEARGIQIQINPPTKKKPEAQDVINTLVKHQVLTPIQKSELDSLFSVANNCAHPKEPVKAEDVERLNKRGRDLASVIF